MDRLADYSTLVVAAATVIYVVVTIFLWRATKRSADAAKLAADAAGISAETSKKAADIDAALHQPYLGVAQFRRINDLNAENWAICWTVRNYGTLPACDVNVEVAVDQNGQSDFARDTSFTGWELLPPG